MIAGEAAAMDHYEVAQVAIPSAVGKIYELRQHDEPHDMQRIAR